MQNLSLNMRPKEFNEIIQKVPIAYLPFGTTEWHGPHLPLGVDTLKVDLKLLKGKHISSLCISDNGIESSTPSLGHNIIETCANSVASHLLSLLKLIKKRNFVPCEMEGAFDKSC